MVLSVGMWLALIDNCLCMQFGEGSSLSGKKKFWFFSVISQTDIVDSCHREDLQYMQSLPKCLHPKHKDNTSLLFAASCERKTAKQCKAEQWQTRGCQRLLRMTNYASYIQKWEWQHHWVTADTKIPWGKTQS